MQTSRWVVDIAFAAALLFANDGARANPQGAELEMARYRRAMAHSWSGERTRARRALAATQTEVALAQLVRDYRQPEVRQGYRRPTLATLLGRYYSGPRWRKELDQLRATHTKESGFWLWANLLRGELASVAPGELRRRIQAEDAPHRMAAHVTALAMDAPNRLFETVPGLLLTLPKSPRARQLLLGAIACAMLRCPGDLGAVPRRSAYDAWISLLEPGRLEEPAERRTVLRALQIAFDVPSESESAQEWRRRLAHVRAPYAEEGPTRARPSFFGIESDGERIVFLIDVSNSMAQQFPHRRSSPRTGPEKEFRSPLLGEGDVRWNLVENRYDLAREHLRIALRRLSPEVRFVVACFGYRAWSLASTPGFVPATDDVLRRVFAELDSIRPRRTTQLGDKAAPVFHGGTNLHGGLRLAFEQLSGTARAKDCTLDSRAFSDGCDTIFVLSDGEPSWDEYTQAASLPREFVGHQDFPGKREGARVTLRGPYTEPHWILDDARRRNALRLVRVHCIGIGEAQMDLLGALAEQNFGKALRYDTGSR